MAEDVVTLKFLGVRHEMNAQNGQPRPPVYTGRRYVPARCLAGEQHGLPRIFENVLGAGFAALSEYVHQCNGVQISNGRTNREQITKVANSTPDKARLLAEVQSGQFGSDSVIVTERGEEIVNKRLGVILEPGDTVQVKAERAADVRDELLVQLDPATGEPVDWRERRRVEQLVATKGTEAAMSEFREQITAAATRLNGGKPVFKKKSDAK